MSALRPSIADCESTQAAWNCAVAIAGGGEVWEDRGLSWAWQAHDGQLMLNFPQAIEAAAVARGVEVGRQRGAHIIGAWLNPEVDVSALERHGFERGWEPWWMSAPLEAIPEPSDPRVTLTAVVPEYGPGGQALLSLATNPHVRAWHAVARLDRRFAGRAWSYLPRDVAGIYDMDVWPRFQRRGLGRSLLRAVCDAARTAGAQAAVLNATPDGERLYSAEGFTRIGTGITYWNHLGCRS